MWQYWAAPDELQGEVTSVIVQSKCYTVFCTFTQLVQGKHYLDYLCTLHLCCVTGYDTVSLLLHYTAVAAGNFIQQIHSVIHSKKT